ncbi:A disintegrin and metalloproteinase with thrombospondin motifs 18, partial [Orchesella cincta]
YFIQQSFMTRILKNEVDASAETVSRNPPTSWSSVTGNEKWKRTGVRFLTRVNWDNADNEIDELGIAGNDFHIIELEAEGRRTAHKTAYPPETLRIHLMRKSSVLHPDFRVVVREDDTEYGWSPSSNASASCHFVGQVTSVPARRTKSSAPVSGIALLSACTSTHGFSGLIIMEDGRQWYIEPVSKSIINKRRYKREVGQSSEEYDTLEHVLLPHEELAGQLAAHVSDVLRVPLPQLEEAARLAALDADARRNMMSLDWDDSGESMLGESSILTPFFHTGASLPFFGRSDRGRVQSKVNLAKKVTQAATTKKTSPTTLLTPLDVIETSASTSQETQQQRVLFTDEELFNKMKSKFTDDTTAQLKEYATAMVNMYKYNLLWLQMDVMYQHATLGVDLRFRLVYLEVMKRKPTSLKTNGGKAKAYLSSFCDYAGEKNANSAQWDHALLLTGIDLHEEGIKTTAGLAWAGTMCYRYYSCSISEGLNFASAYITTHEIGHSLGMEHDGVGISETCDSSKYIMSPTTGPGKVTWSACSSSNLQDFIKYGTSELRGKSFGNKGRMISRPICLEELVTRNKKSIEDNGPDSDLKLPGEKYDANYQCSLGMGSFFKPHFERHKPPFDNICWILYCGNGTHAISTHPALEGTPCDRKKYCRSGQCVKRPET